MNKTGTGEALERAQRAAPTQSGLTAASAIARSLKIPPARDTAPARAPMPAPERSTPRPLTVAPTREAAVPMPAPAREIPRPAKEPRKAKLVPIDVGLRPGGTIDPSIYWPQRLKYPLPDDSTEGRNLWILTALFKPEVGLCGGAIQCYCRLRFYGGKGGVCDPALQTLGSELGLSARTMRRYVPELETANLITSRHRAKHADFGGRTSDVYLPLWHQIWEDAWQEKYNKPSGRTIGEPFGWALFNRELWDSMLLPLEVAQDPAVSADAALYYAALCKRQKIAQYKIEVTAKKSEVAAMMELAGRLERNDSRKKFHKPDSPKAFSHFVTDRVKNFQRELHNWIRVQPNFDSERGRQEANTIHFLQPLSDTRRSPKPRAKR